MDFLKGLDLGGIVAFLGAMGSLLSIVFRQAIRLNTMEKTMNSLAHDHTEMKSKLKLQSQELDYFKKDVTEKIEKLKDCVKIDMEHLRAAVTGCEIRISDKIDTIYQILMGKKGH